MTPFADEFIDPVKWEKAVRKRKPKRWRNAIMRINTLKIRSQVANIVWWDFFSKRSCSKRFSELDDFIESYNPAIHVDPDSVVRALKRIGYPPKLAERRVRSVRLFEQGGMV
jgi:hypothetical protein